MNIPAPFRRASALLLTLCLPLHALADRLHPGYVDLDAVAGFQDAATVVDIRLEGWLLGLARQAADESDDPDARILNSLDSVRVRVFDADTGQADLRAPARALVARLRREGWEDFTTVRGREGDVFILVIGDEKRLDGLTVVAMDDDEEAVLVNVAGRIEARDVAGLMTDSELIHADFDLDF